MVIIDLVMPNFDGKKVYLELKHINPEIKVLMSSGYTQEEDLTYLLKDVDVGFIPKPFRLHELSKIIQETLSS